jgi:hypothetical protein
MNIRFFLICFFLIQVVYGQRKLKAELEFKYRPHKCDSSSIIPSSEEFPLVNQELYVFRDGTCVDTIVTDQNGRVIIKYSPGTYLLFEPWKIKKGTPDGSPKTEYIYDCLMRHWAKPNYKLVVNTEDFQLEYYEATASRCPNQLPCLKTRHLPKLFIRDNKAGKPAEKTSPSSKKK